MKKSFKLSLASLLVSVATFGMVAAIMHNAYSVKETKAWSGEQTPNIGNYYSSISDSLTGSALQSALKQKNDSLSKSPSYDWSRYEAADETDYEYYPEQGRSGVFCELWIPVRKK